MVALTALAVPHASAIGATYGLLGQTAVTNSTGTNSTCYGGAEWNTTHLRIELSSCSGFTVQYAQNSSEWNATQYNFSFGIAWVAEVTPAGQVVRLASGYVSEFTSYETIAGYNEENLSATETLNVTNASGSWTPSTAWPDDTGPQFHISNTSVGTASLGITFQLFDLNEWVGPSANATGNTSLSLKFDVFVSGWPWSSSGDSLGFDLSSLGAGGAHFNFTPATGMLQESWNSNNRTFVSLELGPSANVTYSSGHRATATVGEDVGLFTAGTPDRAAEALTTFENVAGNYSAVAYDPWVVFFPTGVVGVPPPATASPGGVSWWIVVLGVVAAVGAMTVVSVRVVRNERLRREGETLVRDMRTTIKGPSAPRDRVR